MRANALATHAVASPAAGHPVFRDARVRTGRAVTVLAGPATPAHALATVTVAVICKAKRCFLGSKPRSDLGHHLFCLPLNTVKMLRGKNEKKVSVSRGREWSEYRYIL